MVAGLRDNAAVEGSSHDSGKMEIDYCEGVGRGSSSWRAVSGVGVDGEGLTGLRIVVDQGREGAESCSW